MVHKLEDMKYGREARSIDSYIDRQTETENSGGVLVVVVVIIVDRIIQHIFFFHKKQVFSALTVKSDILRFNFTILFGLMVCNWAASSFLGFHFGLHLC